MGLLTEVTKDGAAKCVFMTGVFIAATAVRGEWLLVFAYLSRLFEYSPMSIHKRTSVLTNTTVGSVLEELKLKDLQLYLPLAIISSFVIYYGVCCGFQWYFYINRRQRSKEWKCQPEKFLTPSNERHEILLGSLNMLIGSTVSGFISCYIMNDGYTTLYFKVSDRGWIFFILSGVGFFLYIECLAYYIHRLFHSPYLYKKIHKMHHRYHQPTAFSAVAMHPFEFLLHQSYLAITPFVFPLHAGLYIFMLLYTYYYGLMDHSGIKMDALWPWQPPTTFHDNHHQFFHVNFGFNSYLFDWMHGTLRNKNRLYNENIFGGFGKAVENEKSS